MSQKQIIGIMFLSVFICLLLVSAYFVPRIINNAYKEPYGILDKGDFPIDVQKQATEIRQAYITLWGPKDILLYYGAVLTFIGTMFLGGVALYQNNTYMKLLKSEQKSIVRPIMRYGEYLSQPTRYIVLNTPADNSDHLLLTFRNCGPHIIKYKDNNRYITYGIDDTFELRYPTSGEFSYIDNTTKMEVTLKLKNSLGYSYEQLITFHLDYIEAGTESYYTVFKTTSSFID